MLNKRTTTAVGGAAWGGAAAISAWGAAGAISANFQDWNKQNYILFFVL
jgi:hypothetical protein